MKDTWKNKGFFKRTDHIYGIKNQNGFKNALYDFFDVDYNTHSYTKKDVRGMVQNHPEIYPCTINIIDQSFECCRVYIECFDLQELSHSHPHI